MNTPWMGIATIFKELNSTNLQAHESKVQIPTCGPFDRRDLYWEASMRHYGGHQDNKIVEQCSMPSNRVEDFVMGEDNFKGAKCHYMRTIISNSKKKQPLLHHHINNALYVDKWVMVHNTDSLKYNTTFHHDFYHCVCGRHCCGLLTHKCHVK